MVDFAKPSDINKVWSNVGDNVSPSDAKINGGWLVEIPPRQWFNWLDNKQDQAIAHINQHGIAVWDAVTEYQAGKSYVTGSNGKVYVALQTHTNQNPVTDVSEVFWADVFKPGYVAITTTGVSSWTVPSILKLGLKRARVVVIGGGGGGGNSVASNAGSGGGGGGIADGFVDLTGVTSVSVTVGAGGAAEVSGGTSSFGAFLSATGGSFAAGGALPVLGQGGTGFGSSLVVASSLGPGFQRDLLAGGRIVSGKGGGDAGGTPIEVNAEVTAGNAGTAPGCGGAGGTNGGAGGAGFRGVVLISW